MKNLKEEIAKELKACIGNSNDLKYCSNLEDKCLPLIFPKDQVCKEGQFRGKGGKCFAKKKICLVENGEGEVFWDDEVGVWGECQIKNCKTDFHKEKNKCLSNTRSCLDEITGVAGNQSYENNKWGLCKVKP